MKSLACVAALAACAFPLSAANASVLTIGSGAARACYEASERHDSSPGAIASCDRAFAEEALDQKDRVATLVNRGILHYLNNNLVAAHADYDQAIRLDPNEPEIWLNKGMALLKGGRSPGAAALFDKALSLKTLRPAIAYYGRAVANEDGGNFRQAYADFQRAHVLDPRWKLPGEELKRYLVR
jgi:tetratricopeptide (TPR) repeat protein